MKNKKWTLSLLLFLCSVAQIANAETYDSKEIIYNFYKSYFSHLRNTDKTPEPELDFSASFKKLVSYNKELCHSFPDEVCGWGADGDVYLNAQDYDDSLTMENSNFKISKLPKDVIKVSFNLFPTEKSSQYGERVITYKMIHERNNWVVDDIFYDNNNSSRQQIENENKLLINEINNKHKAIPNK